jgi:hypothetical protein
LVALLGYADIKRPFCPPLWFVKYLKHPSADYDIKPPLTDLNVGCGSYR